MTITVTTCLLRRAYTTQVPKKAAGPFTSNKLIAQPVPNSINKTLVYIGPFANTIQRYKMTATIFGVCGLCTVPALLSTSEAPALSVVLAGLSAISPALFIHYYTRNNVTRLMVHDDIKTVERQRQRPREIDRRLWIGIERCNFFGRLKEDSIQLSDLRDVSNASAKGMVWQQISKPGHRYQLERGVVEADPYLKGLADHCRKQQ